MLLSGLNHVAVLTSDIDRLCRFYEDVFDAGVGGEVRPNRGMRLTFIDLGPTAELNVFEIEGNEEAKKQTPMFGRGRLDHLALEAKDIECFDEIRTRLMDRGASDGFVTDFGKVLSIFFRDPDGLEGEVCVQNPDAAPGVFKPPGTPAKRYHQ